MDFRKTIHRMLLTRIAAVTVLVSAVVLVSAYYLIGQELDRWVVADTVDDFSQYKNSIIKQLDSPGPGENREIQRIIESIPSSARHLSTGKFVVLRILDADGSEIAAISDHDYPGIAAIRKYSERNFDLAALRAKGTWHEVERIERRMAIRIAFPIKNGAGATAAYGDTVFAVSDETMQDTRRTVLRATAAALAIALITALVLYPLIMRLVKRLERLSINLLTANLNILKALGSAVAKRDSDTDIHNYRVTIYSVRLAEAVGLDSASIRALIKGAFLHDVGKIGISDAILHKPGPLTEDEFREMKKHVSHGLDIINNSPWLAEAAPVVGSHHEKFDGSGYIKSVPGQEIPLIARIFSIADVFDALTSQRPYKEPFSFSQAMEILEKGRGIHFDAALLETFVPIARPLYDKYAGGSTRIPQDDLLEIGRRYFTSDIAGQL